jgi:hypothetical protein
MAIRRPALPPALFTERLWTTTATARVNAEDLVQVGCLAGGLRERNLSIPQTFRQALARSDATGAIAAVLAATVVQEGSATAESLRDPMTAGLAAARHPAALRPLVWALLQGKVDVATLRPLFLEKQRVLAPMANTFSVEDAEWVQAFRLAWQKSAVLDIEDSPGSSILVDRLPATLPAVLECLLLLVRGSARCTGDELSFPMVEVEREEERDYTVGSAFNLGFNERVQCNLPELQKQQECSHFCVFPATRFVIVHPHAEFPGWAVALLSWSLHETDVRPIDNEKQLKKRIQVRNTSSGKIMDVETKDSIRSSILQSRLLETKKALLTAQRQNYFKFLSL